MASVRRRSYASCTEEYESVQWLGLRFRGFCRSVFRLDDHFTSHEKFSSTWGFFRALWTDIEVETRSNPARFVR